jgi:hypothetical protein
MSSHSQNRTRPPRTHLRTKHPVGKRWQSSYHRILFKWSRQRWLLLSRVHWRPLVLHSPPLRHLSHFSKWYHPCIPKGNRLLVTYRSTAPMLLLTSQSRTIYISCKHLCIWRSTHFTWDPYASYIHTRTRQWLWPQPYTRRQREKRSFRHRTTLLHRYSRRTTLGVHFISSIWEHLRYQTKGNRKPSYTRISGLS